MNAKELEFKGSVDELQKAVKDVRMRHLTAVIADVDGFRERAEEMSKRFKVHAEEVTALLPLLEKKLDDFSLL
jgi:hypothetical protein